MPPMTPEELAKFEKTPRRQWERRFAVALFKKMEHLDPSDATDFGGAEDWGFSKLDPFDQDYYLTLADTMYCFVRADPPPDDK